MHAHVYAVVKVVCHRDARFPFSYFHNIFWKMSRIILCMYVCTRNSNVITSGDRRQNYARVLSVEKSWTETNNDDFFLNISYAQYDILLICFPFMWFDRFRGWRSMRDIWDRKREISWKMVTAVLVAAPFFSEDSWRVIFIVSRNCSPGIIYDCTSGMFSLRYEYSF